MKTVLITGASSGVGFATTKLLSEQGYKIIALGRNPERMAEVKKLSGVIAFNADITDREAIAALSETYDIDILINNAGIMPPLARFDSAAQADIDRVISINFTAQTVLTRLFMQRMIAKRTGHIVFISSTAAHTPFSNIATYSATKAAISSLAQSLRLEVADYNIRVTELVAGRIETSLYADILSESARHKMYEGGTALQPSDVAESIAFTLSLPTHACCNRLDLVPTRNSTVTSGAQE
ncbi:hypothetical protein BA893_24100 [Vibrio natriegens]|uniref:SDR family oxidoreductase n=1 Tax=Vibrio natriegens TaxID=691 RepID=UPI0008042DF9|nr:SDR family oxidoreductase [Vibrio natriegens]ANQ24678.1 hypothetical protein BA893_24100 [Vibrio natriegens]